VAERGVVAITGASGGVGRAVALEFARHDAAAELIARGCAGLDAAAQEVSGLGGVVHLVELGDVGRVDAGLAADTPRPAMAKLHRCRNLSFG
jgi:short-subunit dehydrogenase